MTERTCGQCRFWFGWTDPKHAGRGECRRYAPKPTVGESLSEHEGYASWGQTLDWQWCGEFEPSAGLAERTL